VALGLACGPAAAAAPTPEVRIMGVVNLELGAVFQDEEDCDGCDDEFMNMAGGGDVNLPLAGGIVNVMLSARGDSAFANETDDNNFGTSFTLTYGMDYRDQTGMVGPFVFGGRVSSIDEDSASFYGGGVQALFFCNDWNFGGQLGAFNSSQDEDGGSDDDFFHDVVFIKGIVDYYLSERTKLGGTLAFANGNQDDDRADLWEWQFKVEHMVGRSVPWSIYGEYRGYHAEEEPPFDQTDNHGVWVGINFLLNATDLQQANRRGVAITPTNFARWSSYAGEQID
jgi:hypothetical protein